MDSRCVSCDHHLIIHTSALKSSFNQIPSLPHHLFITRLFRMASVLPLLPLSSALILPALRVHPPLLPSPPCRRSSPLAASDECPVSLPIPSWYAPSREETVSRLKEEEFDMLVVGGGAVGVGVAMDAATRGLRVALVEKNDFASGTSSRSTKLIHGGLRYLAQVRSPSTPDSMSAPPQLSRAAAAHTPHHAARITQFSTCTHTPTTTHNGKCTTTNHRSPHHHCHMPPPHT